MLPLGRLLTLAAPLFLASTFTKAITCEAAVEAAIESLPSSQVGIEWPCCSRETAECRVDLSDCNRQYPDFATCFSSDSSTACQMTETANEDAPCGAFSGKTGAPGVHAIAHDLVFDGLESAVRANWQALGRDNTRVLCCSASNGRCHMDETVEDLVNPCNRGEYELLCAGSEQYGICSVYANRTETEELGFYFRVNLAEATSSTSSTLSISPTESLTVSQSGSAESTGLTPAGVAVDKDTVNPAAVAVPVVVVVALLVGGLAFFLLRRRRHRQAELRAAVDPMSTYNPSLHPLVSTHGAPSYQGTSRDDERRHLPDESYYQSTERSPTTMAHSAVGASTSSPTTTGKGSLPVQTRAVSPAPPYTAD